MISSPVMFKRHLSKFTKRQREIYEIVLAAQRAGFAAVRPGVTMRDVHRAARDVIKRAGYARYFMHGTSHWLGRLLRMMTASGRLGRWPSWRLLAL